MCGAMTVGESSTAVPSVCALCTAYELGYCGKVSESFNGPLLLLFLVLLLSEVIV